MGGGCAWFFGWIAAFLYLPEILPAEFAGPVRCVSLLTAFAPGAAMMMSGHD